MAKINLEEIVALFLENNRLGKAEYSGVYQLGIAAIRNLKQDATGTTKKIDIKLDRKLTGKLPSDFMNDISVWLQGDCSAGLLKDNTLGNEDEYDEDDCYDSGDFDGLDLNERSSYGEAGVAWIGRYKIDRESQKIFVNPDFCYSCITLTYVGSAKSTESGEWFVDELAREAVEAYIRWKYNLDKRSVGPYEKRLYEGQWKNEKRLAKIRLKNITRNELQDNARSGVKFKAKF